MDSTLQNFPIWKALKCKSKSLGPLLVVLGRHERSFPVSVILRCLWFLNLTSLRSAGASRRPCAIRCRFRILLLILVEIQIYGRRVVKNEVVLTVGRRRDVYVRALTVDVHNVVDYLSVCCCCRICPCSCLPSVGHLVVFTCFQLLLLFTCCLVVVVRVVRFHVERALLRRSSTLITSSCH